MSSTGDNGKPTAESNDPKSPLNTAISEQNPNNITENNTTKNTTEFDWDAFFTETAPPRKGFSHGCVIENMAASDCFWKYGGDPCKPFFIHLKRCRAEEKEKKRLQAQAQKPWFRSSPTTETSNNTPPKSDDTPTSPPNLK